jgi:hypothetical protein
MLPSTKQIRAGRHLLHEFHSAELDHLSLIHDMADLTSYAKARQLVTVQPIDFLFVPTPVEAIGPTAIPAAALIEVSAIVDDDDLIKATKTMHLLDSLNMALPIWRVDQPDVILIGVAEETGARFTEKSMLSVETPQPFQTASIIRTAALIDTAAT